MPARLRLPLALLVCALATAALSLTLWSAEKNDVRDEARERSRGTAAALEQRAGAAVLALQGVRAAYDASSSVGPEAFSTFARVPLARPEIAAVGWVPLVAAAQRGEVEATERIRIEAPAGVPFTYPLVRQEPAATSLDVRDLGSDPSLGEALNSARTTGQPRLSAPVRLPGDGRIGVYAFVPVFAKGLPLRTPAQRRSALNGLVAGAIVSSELVRAAQKGLPDGLDVRITDGPTVLAQGAGGSAIAHAELGGRTWRVSFAPAPASPVAPIGTGLRGRRADAAAGGRLAAASPARGLRSCARDNSRARAEDLRSRARPRRVHDRRGAADAPARRGRERRARPRDRPRRPDQVVLGRSRAAARLHGRRSSSASRSTRSCTRTTCSRPQTARSGTRTRTEPTSCSKAAGSPAATSSGSSPASSPSSAARPP